MCSCAQRLIFSWCNLEPVKHEPLIWRVTKTSGELRVCKGILCLFLWKTILYDLPVVRAHSGLTFLFYEGLGVFVGIVVVITASSVVLSIAFFYQRGRKGCAKCSVMNNIVLCSGKIEGWWYQNYTNAPPWRSFWSWCWWRIGPLSQTCSRDGGDLIMSFGGVWYAWDSYWVAWQYNHAKKNDG